VNSNDHHDANKGKTSKAGDDNADRHNNDKYEGDRDESQNKNRKSVKTNFSSNFEIYDDIINDDPDSLLKPLLSEDDEEGEGVFGMIDNSTKIGNVYILRCCKVIKKQIIQLFINKKIKENEEDWSRYSFSQKVVTVIEYPFVILRDLTIPTMDEDLWYKPYACLQPITIPLFVMYMSGNIEIFFSHPFLILSMSAITSLYILLYTSHNQQSKNVIFVYSWMSLGFIMCIVWICMFANELIICLVLLGQVLNIPSYYLGLTVLAWGNSISDLFSNVAIAKRGLHDMAVVS
jgi:Ca2+/Na+ antiporter